jgi:hypothetical protein
VFALLLLAAGSTQAARVRFHYVPIDPCGTLQLQPGGPSGATAERLAWLGGWEPYNCPPPRPTCVNTYRHPCTGQTVAVPLAMPEGAPTIEYRARTVVYNFGSYTVEVHFLPNGGVDVIYNSGLFRAL